MQTGICGTSSFRNGRSVNDAIDSMSEGQLDQAALPGLEAVEQHTVQMHACLSL